MDMAAVAQTLCLHSVSWNMQISAKDADTPFAQEPETQAGGSEGAARKQQQEGGNERCYRVL